MRNKLYLLVVIGLVNLFIFTGAAFAKVDIKIYYPVQVAGPLTRVIDGFVKEFNETHPDIRVTAVYAGKYGQTMQKAQTAFMTGNPPDIAILRTTSVLMLMDMGAIVPLDEFISDDKAYLEDFYPAFINSVKRKGKIWGIPYQISTPLFYYNKDMFKEAGLDPERPPQNWDQLVEYAQKLTKKDASGNVSRYGLGFPDNNQWMLQAWTLANGGNLANDEGTKVYFNTEPVVESLKMWVKLVNEMKVSIRHRMYGKLSSDFVAGQVAMMYNSTGSLSFVRKSAKFDFGVAFLPKNKRSAVPLGGGHMFMFAKTSKERRRASWEFMRWMSSPERAAEWSIASGYMATRKSALNVGAMKEYTESFPEASVALKQLNVSYPWWTVYEWGKVTKALQTQLVNAVDGKISPEEAMAEAQQGADKILAPYADR
jgi:sn-glycerol 3-phosphate transport system substrate-binding protein